MEFDIVVVGGGAAGVAAARRLAGRGLKALLLEASAHLGGRGRTLELQGLSLDLGCGWLHSAERNGWAVLATELGVDLDKRKAAWGVQYRELGFPAEEQRNAKQALEAWGERLSGSPPPGDVAADALRPDCEWNAYIRAIAAFISGASMERLSAADYAAYHAASSEENWRSRTGLGNLIASAYPREIPLGLATPLTSLELLAEGVKLRTRGGDIRARAAILTVSSAVLAGDTLRLPRELQPWQAAARLLPLGHTEKLYLEIVGDSEFEPETQVIGNPRDRRTASYYLRPFGWPVVECFFGGEGAGIVIDGGHAVAFAQAIDQLANLFGSGVRHHLRPLVGSNWARMPRIGGAYSYALPGQSQARQTLAAPFDGRVFFAGEATSTADYSTVHGAHDSGIRAADEAIFALGRPA
jgi:monoamine oxidase